MVSVLLFDAIGPRLRLLSHISFVFCFFFKIIGNALVGVLCFALLLIPIVLLVWGKQIKA